MKTNKQKVLDAMKKQEYIGMAELPNSNNEHDTWDIIKEDDKLFYGTGCNVGFNKHGYMVIDPDFDIDANLTELLDNLETMAIAGSADNLSNELVEIIAYEGGL
jgi:hypothetical protein